VNRRWYVSDFQRILIYFAVVAAVFLAAMALGWQKLWLLLAALGVLAVTALGVVAAAARRGAGTREIVTARVLSVSEPPPNTGIAARCDMVLEVRLPNRAPVGIRHRDPAVPLERWPQPGSTFPVEVRGGNPRRRLRIRWDLVNQGMVRAPDAPSADAAASPAFVWEEENEPIVYSPTPPRPRRPPGSSPSSTTRTSTPPASPPPPSPPPPTPPPPTPPPPTPPPPTSSSPAASSPPASAPPPSPSSPPPTAATTTTVSPATVSPATVSPGEVVLHETFTDLDEAFTDFTDEAFTDFTGGAFTGRKDKTVSPRPAVDQPRADPNGHDPDGYDPADFETPQLAAEPPDPAPAVTGGPGFETITLSDFDPADVDIRDFMDEPPAVTRMPPDDEPAAPATAAAPPGATAASPAFGRTTPPPTAGQASADQATADQATADQATADQATADQATADQTAVEPAPAEPAPPAAAERATAERSSSDRATSERAASPAATERAASPAATERTGSAAGGPAIPQPRDPGRMTSPGTGVSVSRPVADLNRSLRFYRDVLGFSVVFTSAKSAVVERQGSRVVLDERRIQPSPGEVHLDVTDIEEVCASVRAGDGEVIEAPAPVHGGRGLQLWRARLRDPDGHAVEVIEWRGSGAR